MVYALRYNEKAAKIMIIGFLLLIFVESIWFLSSLFSKYYLLKLNPFVLAIEIIGIFTLLYGFKEAMK